MKNEEENLHIFVDGRGRGESELISSEPSRIHVCITKYNNIDGRKARKPGVCEKGVFSKFVYYASPLLGFLTCDNL
jgi:hypothetical protein